MFFLILYRNLTGRPPPGYMMYAVQIIICIAMHVQSVQIEAGLGPIETRQDLSQI